MGSTDAAFMEPCLAASENVRQNMWINIGPYLESGFYRLKFHYNAKKCRCYSHWQSIYRSIGVLLEYLCWLNSNNPSRYCSGIIETHLGWARTRYEACVHPGCSMDNWILRRPTSDHEVAGKTKWSYWQYTYIYIGINILGLLGILYI